MDIISGNFVWNRGKEIINIVKHGLNFHEASKVFNDKKIKIFFDIKHSIDEPRYFGIGKVNDKIITVRFTFRRHMIRIIGAGYWANGRKYYEKEKDKR